MNYEEIRKEREELDKKLHDIRNLIDALQTVAWDMAQERIELGSARDRQRNAVIGLADAMEARAGA